MSGPAVSVMLPVLDEIAFIDACLTSLVDQDYPGPVEILVADGGSTDGTLARLDEWSSRLDMRVIDNPDRVQSAGINRVAVVARGDVLVRADAHTTYAPDYIRRSIETLAETGAEAVGGPMAPAGETPFGRAVAAMMRHRLGVGPAPFHHGGMRREVDTVYLGAITKEAFLRLGGLRTLPSRVAEDADFYWRLRQEGGRVVMDPTIRSVYRPRETPGSLWRQFWRYGVGKADMLYVNGRWPSWRPLAPMLLVLGLLAGLVVGVWWSWWPVIALFVMWLGVLAVAARGRVLEVVAAGIMHLSYGLGLLRGLLRWPAAVRRAVRV